MSIHINSLSLTVKLLPNCEPDLQVERLISYFPTDYLKIKQTLTINDGCKIKFTRSGNLTLFLSSHIKLYLENFDVIKNNILDICNLLSENIFTDIGLKVFNIHSSGTLEHKLHFKDIFNSDCCKDLKKKLQVSKSENAIEIDSWKSDYTGCTLSIVINPSDILRIFNPQVGNPTQRFVGLFNSLEGFNKHVSIINSL